MKKCLFIIGMTAMLMASCSSDDGTAYNSKDELSDLDIEALNSDVPITFGIVNGEAESDATRGTLLSTEFAAEDVGVYMLARKKLTSSWSPNWQSTNVLNQKLNVWLDNVAADIVYDEEHDISKFTWANNDEQHFYPSLQRYLYEFISYYPRTENVYHDVMSGNNYQVIYGIIDIDGSQDVCYAHATTPSPTTSLAFSSEYFKQVADAETPHFQYKHKLARMQVKVRLAYDSDEYTDERMGDFYVDSIYLENMPYRLKLQIAYKGPQKSDGTVEINGGGLYTVDPATLVKNFYLRQRDNSSIADQNYQLSNTAQVIGDAILFYPTTSSLALRVVIRDRNGSRYSPVNPITVAPPTSAGWEAGTSYSISVKLTDPVKVEATARADAFTPYGSEISVTDDGQ